MRVTDYLLFFKAVEEGDTTAVAKLLFGRGADVDAQGP